MKRRRYKRIYEWSPDIAYNVGLIASDGCLSGDGRHVDVTSKDLEQLVNFSKGMGRDIKIGTKPDSHGGFAYRIQFSDVAYYDFLIGVGLTPAKSKTIGKLSIPDELYPDFLRGLFDGDGSCNGYMDPRWRSSFMFYIKFASASPSFVEYLRKNNTRLIGVSKGSIQVGRQVLSLSYAKADSHLIYKYMYYDELVPSLTRKRTKLKGFVDKDSVAIIN